MYKANAWRPSARRLLCVGERPRLREQRPDRAGYVMVEDRHAIV
jgi:hypothetical protein